MARIIILDYDMGNLASVQNAFRAVGYEALISPDPGVLAGADALVLPGVGAFGSGMAKLAQRGLIEPIKVFAASGRPMLGICLGMQLLFEVGEESGAGPGLGLLKGRVVRLPDGVKLPQIGWNQVQVVEPHPLFEGLSREFFAYFDHSYAAAGVESADLKGITDYGQRYPSVVGRGNLVGVQFHPEKSAQVGLQMIENWGRFICSSPFTRPSI